MDNTNCSTATVYARATYLVTLEPPSNSGVVHETPSFVSEMTVTLTDLGGEEVRATVDVTNGATLACWIVR